MATAPTAWRLLGRPTTSVVLSHLLDRCDVGLRGASLADRVGGNHACGRDDEHRLMAIITENSRSSTERPWIPSVPPHWRQLRNRIPQPTSKKNSRTGSSSQ